VGHRLRGLGRNQRRSFLSLLAVALGLLILLNGYIAGVLEDSLQNGIRLETGHVQIRAASYQREKLSLLAKDLLADSDALAARASAMSEVKAAAPVLWAGGILNTADDSAGVQIYGVDTASAVFAPIRDALADSEWLAADDRGGILIGKSLAGSMGVGVGQRVSLSLMNADGQADEGIFTVRGLFSTGVVNYDNGPLHAVRQGAGLHRRRW
jgi:ABC-type lipoprotein release transport system permease subunit